MQPHLGRSRGPKSVNQIPTAKIHQSAAHLLEKQIGTSFFAKKQFHAFFPSQALAAPARHWYSPELKGRIYWPDGLKTG